MKLLKKISVKTVVGKINVATLTDKPTPLYTVVGQATGYKTGLNARGRPGEEQREWTGFEGAFLAIKPDGEQFRASVCFLNDSVDGMLKAALANSGGAPVEFSFNVTVAKADNPIGYEYAYESNIEPTEADPLLLLMARTTASKTPALSPPAPAPAPAPIPGPAVKGKARKH